MTLESLLVFFSGADKVPAIGFPRKPELYFIDGDLATASTCALILRLPLNPRTYDEFKSKITLSINGTDDFGCV